MKVVLLFGLIITFSSNISFCKVPSKITASVSKEKGCLGCHEGIEEIREPNSMMLMQTKIIGKVNGDPNGCVTCHGGNPKGLTAKESHLGAPKNLANGIGPKTFYPDPGSIWIANRTCGQCHAGYPYRLERGLMNTEAGKIQGNLHTWGIEKRFRITKFLGVTMTLMIKMDQNLWLEQKRIKSI